MYTVSKQGPQQRFETHDFLATVSQIIYLLKHSSAEVID